VPGIADLSLHEDVMLESSSSAEEEGLLASPSSSPGGLPARYGADSGEGDCLSGPSEGAEAAEAEVEAEAACQPDARRSSTPTTLAARRRGTQPPNSAADDGPRAAPRKRSRNTENDSQQGAGSAEGGDLGGPVEGTATASLAGNASLPPPHSVVATSCQRLNLRRSSLSAEGAGPGLGAVQAPRTRGRHAAAKVRLLERNRLE
jgi:hypothetical protein